MILALDFCGSAFTGIQWVLYNPGGLRVNTSLHFFFFWYSVFSLLASESLGPPTSPRLRKSKSLPCEG